MLNRTHPPKSTPLDSLQLTSPTQYQIAPTTPLFVFQDNLQQVIQLTFTAQKKHCHARLKNILPYFFAKTIIQGTKNYTKAEIANHIDQYGASLEASTTYDTFCIELTTLPSHFHDLIPLFAEILQQPSFPEEALILEKKLTHQDIQLRDITPQALARKKLAYQAFGSKHPYSYRIEIEDLDTVTQDSLHHYFNNHAWYNPYFTLTGHLNQSLIEATQQIFSTLPTKDLIKTSYTTQTDTKLLQIHQEEAIQASIAMGKPTIRRTHPDYPTFYILNMLLGGYFGSRLMQNIREEKGYTYGISSRLISNLHSGFFYIGTEVKKGFSSPTCKEINHEIHRLQNDPISLKELQDLKDFLSGNLLISFENIFSLASSFEDLYLQGLDFDYYNGIYQKIETIQPEEIQACAQKYLSPKTLAQVIVNE